MADTIVSAPPAAPAASAPGTTTTVTTSGAQAPAVPAAAPATPATQTATSTAEPPKKDATTLMAEPAAEVQYDLKLPKDSKLQQADVDAVAAFAKENKVSPEVAQKMLEREHAQREAFQTAHQKGGPMWWKKVEAYEADALADPDLGAGDPAKLKAVAEQGRRVLEKYGNPALKQYLIDSGLGSNKDVLRFFYNIAKASREDTLVSPQPAAGVPTQTGDLVEMYKPKSQRK